jgi:hypothetical protein
MGSKGIPIQLWSMSDADEKTLPCGCLVKAYRDFLGRVVGTILTRGPECQTQEHTAGYTVVMPGRENARPE